MVFSIMAVMPAPISRRDRCTGLRPALVEWEPRGKGCRAVPVEGLEATGVRP